MEFVNSKPIKDAFGFLRAQDKLRLVGLYSLEYSVAPVPPGGQRLAVTVQILVTPGVPAVVRLQVWPR